MIKIFCITPDVTDGAAICRVHPYKYLGEMGYPVQVQMQSGGISGYDIDWADVVVFHRPTGMHALPIAQAVKLKNKKLIVDNDDDYFNVPVDHRSHITFNDVELRRVMTETTKLADLMTLANEEAVKTFAPINANYAIYPCVYDERYLKAPDLEKPRTQTIMWRGSDTHNQSLYEFSDAIGELDKEHTGWEFIFVGAYPWHVIKKIKNNKWWCNPGYMPTKELWEYARNIGPAIQIVPLTDDQFTRSRSNMAFMDATTAGALTVARNFKHFMVPGVINYRDSKDFTEIMHRLMDTFPEQFETEATRDKIMQSWKYIEENLTFKAVAPKLFSLIEKVVGGIV